MRIRLRSKTVKVPPVSRNLMSISSAPSTVTTACVCIAAPTSPPMKPVGDSIVRSLCWTMTSSTWMAYSPTSPPESISPEAENMTR